MKLTTIIFVGLLCFSRSFGQPEPIYATSGRVLTIETWRSYGEGTVWAVLSDEIIVYRQFDTLGDRDTIVGRQSISAAQAKAIRAAISAIPKESYGFRFSGAFSTHPPLLRLYFTEDGKWTNRRIEVDGYEPRWAKKVLDAVSDALPQNLKVDFYEHVLDYLRMLPEGSSPPEISKISIGEYYGEEKPWWKIW